MRTIWSLVVALNMVASAATAQTVVVAARPTLEPDLRILPTPQQVQAHSRTHPEAIPRGQDNGEAKSRLSLALLEALALANNPALARAGARVEAARGQWVQVGLPPNPVAGYSAAEMGQAGRAGQQGGFISQQIVTAGKLGLNRAVAGQEIVMAEQQFAAQRLRVLNDVRLGSYDVLVAQRRIDIAREFVAISERTLQTVEKLLDAQEASRNDLLQARVEHQSARVLLDNAQNDYVAAWRNLAAVVGVPDMQPTPLAGDLAAGMLDIAFEDVLQRLLTQSPELAVARANVNRAQQAALRARAEPIPNLDLQAGVQHDNATGDDIASVQVGIPIPVFNRNQGGIRRAQADVAAAQSGVRRVELSLHRRLAATYQRYANARQQVDTYVRAILPDAQSSLDLVTNGYRQGEFGYLMLLTAQRTFFQTNLAYLESLRQLQQATIAIDGLLLSDSLATDDVSP